MSSIRDWLFGSSDKLKKFPTGTPQQQALGSNVAQQALGMYGSGGGYDLANQYYNNFLGPNQQQGYEQFAAPYLQQFEEQILPMLAERFGGMGALSSSGFAQSLGGAGAGLQSQLAQVFAELQRQAAGQQYNQTNQLTQTGLNYQPFGYLQQKGSAGFLSPLLSGLGTAIAGPVGAGIGKGITNLLKPKAAQGEGIT